MLPALAVTGNDFQDEGLERDIKCSVISHLIIGAKITTFYAIFVWYFEHKGYIIFSYYLIKNIRLKINFVPYILSPAYEVASHRCS